LSPISADQYPGDKARRNGLERIDPTGNLSPERTDACCGVRKVEPLARGVGTLPAWFTGRKRSRRQRGQRFLSSRRWVRASHQTRWPAGTTADQAD